MVLTAFLAIRELAYASLSRKEIKYIHHPTTLINESGTVMNIKTLLLFFNFKCKVDGFMFPYIVHIRKKDQPKQNMLIFP